ncbi:acyl carrier protein [Microbispora sp. NEAU-D428]|uniref:acyl carrier protein n=1 Tax=Microbispora sitophila TaxID=2771537 RepID=UPI001868D355|nr:acyl carrier protein [Microbispora sitophila]MBE3015229.1 acyl carrier protein [Microbispora sitophila]
MTKKRLAELVAESSDGAVTADEVLAATVPLSALGVTSITMLRLIDAIESEFGVEFDLSEDGMSLLDDLDRLAAHLASLASR